MESPIRDRLTKHPLANHENSTPACRDCSSLPGWASSASQHRPAAYLVLPSSFAT